MTEPTDAEILDAADDFRSQYMHGGITFDEFDSIGFARAVLAKWGTPPAVAERLEVTEAECEAAVLELEIADLHTTPHPTQAQAVVCEPLTDEQIRAMLNKHPPEDVCAWSYRMGIDDAELHHGIKGGQYGAE